MLSIHTPIHVHLRFIKKNLSIYVLLVKSNSNSWRFIKEHGEWNNGKCVLKTKVIYI